MFDKLLRSYWFVFLLPAVLIIFSFLLKAAAGPFWQYADASYIYLLNSVNIIKGIPAAFYDQPGTSLQLLGSAIILIMNIGHPTSSTIHNVLVDPESYLCAINIVLLLLIAISSFVLGAYTYHKTQDVVAALLSQIPNVLLLSLSSTANYHPLIFSTINAEPLLLVVSNIFNMFLLKLFFSKTDKDENVNVLILGFIVGLGVATKLTFLPIIALPLILARWSIKPFLVVIAVASFILWTLPIITFYPKLWAWVVDLLTHTGVYGNGTQGIIDINVYLSTLELIFQRFWFLILLTVTAFIISTVQIIKDRKNRAAYFLIAISLTVLMQFAVIAKHFDEHYLVLALNSFGPFFVLVYLYLMPKNVFIKITILALLGTATIQSGIMTAAQASKLAEMTTEVVKFNKMIHLKYPNSIYIGSYLESPIRNSEYGLFMGNDSSGGGEKQELSQLYPNSYSLFTESRDISGTCTYGLYNFKHSVWADDLLTEYSSIIFINSGYDFASSPYIVKPLDEGKYSKAYLLVGSTEKAADLYFNAAIQMLQKGDYQHAFGYALKSRELHYQPLGKINYVLSFIYSQIKH